MMTFGTSESRPWALPEEQAEPIVRAAVEGGITFFDTADVYNDGRSEVVTGNLLRKLFGMREEYVVATKVHGQTMPGENGRGLSRKAILTQIDQSLLRLGTDYVDLYQIHRWDPVTPIEETMRALDDVVRAGKVRYLGASSMWGWQLSKAQHVAAENGWTQFVSMQNHYNLLNREEEREMLPLCADLGMGVIPWSPLARGRLARPWGEQTVRSENDEFGRTLYDTSESDRTIVERVGELAEARALPRAQIALAWLLANPHVTAPIVGATQPHHLDDAVAAVDLELSADELATLQDAYVPHRVAGFA